jgi:tetratricopeptide (TPR) repeat protein
MTDRRPIRVLFLAAQPRGERLREGAQLRIDREIRTIQDAFERARADFSLRQYWATRPGDFGREVLKFNPQIVHFSGHGVRRGIILENEIGSPKLVGSSALASLFALFSQHLSCVILNACYSRTQAEEIAAHIPFVIGMNTAISDDAAVAFSAGFYEALGEEQGVEFAFQWGLSRIQLEGLPEESTPELISRDQVRGTATAQHLPSGGKRPVPGYKPTNSMNLAPDSTEPRRNTGVAFPWPTSLEDLSCMRIDDFETLCVKIVEDTYKGSNLEVTHARLSNDGKNGDAHYELSIRLATDVHIVFRIWLEPATQRQRELDQAGVASRVGSAIVAKIHKVILVTDRYFSESLRHWLEEFTARTGLQCQLIDGPNLLDRARAYRSGEFNNELPPLISKKAPPADHPKPDAAPLPPDVMLSYWFSLSPPLIMPTSLGFRHITVRADRPVYLGVEMSFSTTFATSQVSLTVNASTSSVDSGFYPWPPKATSAATIAQAGDKIRKAFIAWPDPTAEPVIPTPVVTLTAGATTLAIGQKALNSLKANRPVLVDTRLPGQDYIYAAISAMVDRWKVQAEFFTALISAPPGVGKSRIMSQLRRYCQGAGIQEILLDCEALSTDVDFLRALLRVLLPFPPTLLDYDLVDPLTEWCVESGIEPEMAAEVARDLCGPADHQSPLPVRYRLEVGDAVLTSAARLGSVALFVEDLHKASPSLLSFLSALMARLGSTGESQVFLIASTRPFYSGTADLRGEWLGALTNIARADRCAVFELAAPSVADAQALLLASITGLEPHHAQEIISAVGTSPFNLREAVLYMLATDTLTFLRLSERQFISVADPLRLRTALSSHELSRSTAARLGLLLENQATHLRLLLLAGAVYGRRFPISLVLAALRIADDPGLASLLDICSQWSVIAPALDSLDWFEFDHDLVRETLLTIGPSRSRVYAARALLDADPEGVPSQIRCRLAYQAGLSDECLAAARAAKEEAKSEGRVADIIEYNQLAIQVLDPEIAASVLSALLSLNDQGFLDPALRTLDGCAASGLPHQQRMELVLDLLIDNVDHLCTVGSGSSGAVEAAISEARLISARLDNQYRLAQLLYFEGRMWFERNCVAKAITLHEQAESLFALGSSARDLQRAENLVRQAICLRKDGRTQESLEKLWRAARLRPRANWLLLNKIRNNFGAAYLRSDWAKVRLHWEKQIRQATRKGLPGRKVHGLASLSFIDLFEGKLDNGFAKAREGLELAERLRLDNQIVRLSLDSGIYFLMTGRPDDALLCLLKAEQLALRHGIGRRLWRVMADLATAYEVIRRQDRAVSRDLQTLRQLTGILDESSLSSREMLPLVNVVLRAQSDASFDFLLAEIPAYILGVAREYATLVLTNKKQQLPAMLGNYCVSLTVGPRFLLSE